MMNNKVMYLGQQDVDVKDTPFKDFTDKDWALKFIAQYGSIDGNHHKQWVLDKVARILNGEKVAIKLALWSDGIKEYRYTLNNETKEYKNWKKSNKWLDVRVAP